MGPTKVIWDPHDLVGLMRVLTNQRECVEKCVLEGVLLAFLLISTCIRNDIGSRRMSLIVQILKIDDINYIFLRQN